jgi:hypothetical protein
MPEERDMLGQLQFSRQPFEFFFLRAVAGDEEVCRTGLPACPLSACKDVRSTENRQGCLYYMGLWLYTAAVASAICWEVRCAFAYLAAD